MFKIVFIILVFALLGCDGAKRNETSQVFWYSSKGDDATGCNLDEQLYALTSGDPLSDASESFSKKDFRFFATSGFSAHVPGVCISNSDYKKMNLKIICGPGDYLVEPDLEKKKQISDLAKLYAHAYNTHMLILLSQ